MSLDVVVLGLNGAPEKAASVSVDAHDRLLKMLNRRFPMLSRLSEYYEDVSYDANEIKQLHEEVCSIKNCINNDLELSQFIYEFFEVLAIALERECGIEVISD